MHSIAAIGGQLKPDSVVAQRSLELGLVCQFAARVSSHAQLPVGAMVSALLRAQSVGQLKVYLNGYDECVGYVVWALLTSDVEDAFLEGAMRPLEDWEMNDGTSAWILDMAVSPESLPYVLEDMRDVVFRSHQHLTYFRVKGGRRICKRVSRDDRTSFMRSTKQSVQERQP